MDNIFRSLTFGLTTLLGSMAFAQPLPPYDVTIVGTVVGCTPNSFVNITSGANTLPTIDIDVPVGANCNFDVTVQVDSPVGSFQVGTPCNGILEIATFPYEIDSANAASIFVTLVCGNALDCLGQAGGTALPGTPCDDGNPATSTEVWDINCVCAVVDSTFFDCLNLPGGPNLPGTACSTPNTGIEGTWNANCICVPNNPDPCQAGFWAMQAYTVGDSVNNPNGTQTEPIPFELWIWNQSSGGTGIYQFVWDFGDGSSSSDAFPTHVYSASGPYTICLTMTDDAGCTSTFCDEISVDQDGILGMGTGFDARSVLTIRVIQELPTGITERPALEATNLWPNPVAEQFNLTLNSSRSGNLSLSIVDLNGREVRTMNASILAGNNQLPMDVSGLEPGMYLLRFSNGSNSAAMRFVKH
ncbi:MAG: PKD domain-containing protein [Flavobacteriales bacterium]